jgi:hypothetical protein
MILLNVMVLQRLTGLGRSAGAVSTAILILMVAPKLWGQFEDPVFLEDDRPEAWAMKYFTSISVLSGYGPLEKREAGWIDLGMEIMDIPHLGEGYRRVGFNGVKDENLNNAPFMFRPRVSYYFHPRLAVTVSYVPPIEVWGITPNILSGALEWRVLERGAWSLGARLYGQTGSVKGPFSCSEDNVLGGEDFERNPFGCNRVAKDRVSMDYFGAEFSVARRFAGIGGLTPFFSAGWNSMHMQTDLDSSLFFEPHRRTEIATDDTYSLVGGARIPVGDRWTVGLQVYYSPLDVLRLGKEKAENDSLIHARLQFVYHLGKLGARKQREEGEKN